VPTGIRIGPDTAFVVSSTDCAATVDPIALLVASLNHLPATAIVVAARAQADLLWTSLSADRPSRIVFNRPHLWSWSSEQPSYPVGGILPRTATPNSLVRSFAAAASRNPVPFCAASLWWQAACKALVRGSSTADLHVAIFRRGAVRWMVNNRLQWWCHNKSFAGPCVRSPFVQ